jgi:hypothetical protein
MTSLYRRCGSNFAVLFLDKENHHTRQIKGDDQVDGDGYLDGQNVLPSESTVAGLFPNVL